MPVEHDDKGTYIFSSKDMCLVKEIPEIVDPVSIVYCPSGVVQRPELKLIFTPSNCMEVGKVE